MRKNPYSKVIGDFCEQAALEQLEAAGCKVEPLPDGTICDLLIEDHNGLTAAEVKGRNHLNWRGKPKLDTVTFYNTPEKIARASEFARLRNAKAWLYHHMAELN